MTFLFLCFILRAEAAGFQIQEQNVTNLGLAYSGISALAEDASTGYYNAGGLTRLGESQLVLSGVLIQGDFNFTATGSNVSLLPNTPVLGANQDNPAKMTFVPTFHLFKRLNERWVLGFNVVTPFGLVSQYEDTGIVRYMATKSQLQTVNLGPSLAYKISPHLSVGAGVDAEYLKAVLDLRIGGGIAALDGFQKNKAEGWGVGWHAGVLWQPQETTRLGFSYRAKVNIHAEGSSENLLSNAEALPGVPILVGHGNYFTEKVRADVVLPEMATLGLYQAFTDKFAVTADLNWTHWHRFHTLRLRFQPPVIVAFTPALGIPSGSGLDTDTWERFEDTLRVAAGVIYTHNANWLMRFGVAFDPTPTRDLFRTARIPDQDRTWLAIGGAYAPRPNWRIDFGYAHLFFKNVALNEEASYQAYTKTPATRATLSGNYRANANLVGIQIRYDFV